MRMGTGVEVLTNGQEHSCAASTSELVQWSGQLQTWWKQYPQEFPDLDRMARQYLTVPATSAFPERFFSRVGLVQTDLRGSLLDTTMIDLMWAKQAP